MRLLERDAVLDRLDSLLDEVKSGVGRVVAIHGEAGVGKTAVVKVFTQAHGADSHVLWAGCDDLVATRPLGPIWDIAVEEIQLSEPLNRNDRLTVFRGVLDLLGRTLRPTVLVVEDVHWADEATLDLVRYVGRRIEGTSGLLVLTYRDPDVGRSHPLRSVIGDLPHERVERLSLAPLSRDAVTLLVEDESRADRLWRITGGNPFFLTELLGSDEATLPESVKDSIHGRSSRLTPEARNLVELVSVVPTQIRMPVVERILGAIVDLVEECERTGILEMRGEVLCFRHELARRAIEEDLEEIRRRELNRAVLVASEALGEPLSRCAHHAWQTGDAEAILRLVPAAAREAAALASHREALSLLEAFEPFLDRLTPEQLADHYELWAREQYLDDPVLAEKISEKAVEQSRPIGDPVRLGGALLTASQIKWMNTKRDEAVALAQEAAAVLEEVGGEQLASAYTELSRLAMTASNYDETMKWADLALAHAGDGPSYTRAQALVNRGSMKATVRFPHGIDDLEEAYRLSLEYDLPDPLSRSVNNLAIVHLYWRRPDLAEPWIRLGIELGAQYEWRFFGHALQGLFAELEELKGNWAQAESLARSLLHNRDEMTTPELVPAIVLAGVMIRRGDPEAVGVARDAWETAKRMEDVGILAWAGSIIAEHLWLGGDLDETLIDELSSVVGRCIDLDVAWGAGDLAQFLSLAGALDAVPSEIPEPYGLIDRGEWMAAATFWENRGIPYQQAVALSQGDAPARLNALEILNNLGALPLAQRLRSQLRDAGIRTPRGPHKATTESPWGLTRRQTEVLELLAQRLSNEQIANRLYLSARTVENHVSSILHKLGAHDRDEAVLLAEGAEVTH